MTTGSLSARLSELCTEIETWIDDTALPEIRAVRAQLAEPLRVAVVGRVKAGKSTLVNALVGMHVAPTAATECTRVVTWYRFGTVSKADLVLKDGTRQEMNVLDGLPDTIGVPLEDASHIDVEVPSGALKELTLVDTPGLASLTGEREEATREAVLGQQSSLAATGQIDAVIFVFRDVEHEDEIEFLRSFQASTGQLGATASNAIGVLSHADIFGSGPFGTEDPINAATARAEQLGQDRQGEMSEVVAVAGLLAETARTGRLTEQLAAALARLAQLDPPRLRLSISGVSRESPGRVKPHEALGVPDATLRKLLAILGPYAVLHAREVAGRGAAATYSWAGERSQIARLGAILSQRFTRRTDVLKAGKAFSALERLRYSQRLTPQARLRLADILETVWMERALHKIRELRAMEMMRRQVAPEPAVVEALKMFVDGVSSNELLGVDPGADRESLREAARAKSRWALGVSSEATANLELREAALVLSQSYSLMAEAMA